MTIKEFKGWINRLPEELDDYNFLLKTIKPLGEDKTVYYDEPITSCDIDEENKEMIVFSVNSLKH